MVLQSWSTQCVSSFRLLTGMLASISYHQAKCACSDTMTYGYDSTCHSSSSGHGAWRTLFKEHSTPDGTLVFMMLQVPLEGVLAGGGIASILRVGQNLWLGNAATFKDFYFDLGLLPRTEGLNVTDGVNSDMEVPMKALDLSRCKRFQLVGLCVLCIVPSLQVD